MNKKRKFGTFHFLCLILIQIALLDVILIVFVSGKVNEVSGSPFEPAEDKNAISGSTSFKTRIKEEDVFDSIILADLVRNVGLKRTKTRDLKLKDVDSGDMEFIATTYDLSYESCGKYPSHPAYGITFSGKKAMKGRTIAVDPKVIPLGSSVYIEFPAQYSHLNGWYIAEDTGSKVKGNIVDVFLGESAFSEMKKFGSRRVKVKVAGIGSKSLVSLAAN